MDLQQLETFLAVVQERSFSRAAQRLRRTQPAVSQVIRKLEDELGEPLFERASLGTASYLFRVFLALTAGGGAFRSGWCRRTNPGTLLKAMMLAVRRLQDWCWTKRTIR